jgi:transcriptional regulator with XRE-family HTH domain
MDNTTPKALKKSFKSVSSLLQGLGAEKETIDAVKDAENQTLTNILIKMRVSQGMTQADVARFLGCSQGRISKLESGRDIGLRLSDLLDYHHATGVPLNLMIGPKNPADAIKHHVFAMKRHLDVLTKLAAEDGGEIKDGITQFFEEVMWNVALRLGECQNQLKDKPQPATPEIEVVAAPQIIEKKALAA